MNMDCTYDAGLERLDDLGVAGRDDPSIGSSDDVKSTNKCPCDGHNDKETHYTHQETASRRYRRFDYFQSSGQELTFVPAQAPACEWYQLVVRVRACDWI
jgi:hypothetical protein